MASACTGSTARPCTRWPSASTPPRSLRCRRPSSPSPTTTGCGPFASSPPSAELRSAAQRVGHVCQRGVGKHVRRSDQVVVGFGDLWIAAGGGLHVQKLLDEALSN